MKFVRAVWKLLVGIKDALVLVLLLLFFAGLYGVLSARTPPVGEGVLDLNLNGRRRRAARARQWSEVANGSARTSNIAFATSSRRWTRPRTMTGSRRWRWTSTASPAAAQTAMGDLADAVRRVRGAGKPVVAYAVGYTNDSYQLASAASEIWLNPLGAVAIAGPRRLEPLFQGPARQARSHRQRLSRRHLQVGGRAVHPQ